MPTIHDNQKIWSVEHEWSQQGEEWSSKWGGSEAQWFGAILPRIHAFVPTGTILEIAPGFGRWTNHLRKYCTQLVAVDLAENCIDACRLRFPGDSHLTFRVNDGKSLAMVEDRSIDFAFSFDSLVHVEAEVIEAYLNQLSKKLKPNGIGFFHRSNMGRYRRALSLFGTIPGKLGKLATRIVLGPDHWRAVSMTAKLFETYCESAGLQCIGQELINWGTSGILNDCFSLFTPKNSIWSRFNRLVENTKFMKEAQLINRLSNMYTIKSFESNACVSC